MILCSNLYIFDFFICCSRPAFLRIQFLNFPTFLAKKSLHNYTGGNEIHKISGRIHMGLRFRKSFKIAPGVKVNLNKKSAGVTIGTKGAHYTINTSGKRTASVGIPGTGLSYSTSSGGGKKGAKKKKDTSPKATFNKVLGIIIAVVAIVCTLNAVKGSLEEKAAQSASSAQTVSTVQSDTATADSGADAAVSDTAQAAASGSSSDAVAQSAAASDTKVWISASGSKYHTKSDCSGMENATEITLQEALDMGKEACKRCD